MKRATNRWLMGFSVSFGVTFLAMMSVLGAICFLSYTRTGAAGRAQASIYAEKPPDTTYLPEAEDRLTLLVSAAEDADTPPDTYILLAFLPDRGKIAVCVLPAITYLEYGGQGTTIGRMDGQGGIGYAKKGVEQYLDIPIHRTARVDTASLDDLIACRGLMDYELVVDLDYPLHGRQIVMPRGHYQLTGRRVMDIIAYPAYPGGERERSDRAALLVTEMITQTLPVFLDEEEGARFRQAALESIETDLSAADCLRRRAALRFLARLELPATTVVLIDGSLSRSYTVYRLSEGCRERIGAMFRQETA